MGDQTGRMTAVVAWAAKAEYAEKQYRHGDAQIAEAALIEYITALDALHAKDPDFLVAHAYWFDRMIAQARLARIRESTGDKLGAAEFMAAAVASCSNRGQTDCSEETIRGFQRRLDSERPFLGASPEPEGEG